MTSSKSANEAVKYFQPYYKVPSEALDTSDEVNKFASGYVEFNHDPKYFNFNHFRSAVDAYGGNDLIGGNFWEASIELEDNLDRMADAVPSLIGHVPDGIDSGDLVKTIKATFADLRTVQQNGWADFHPQSSTHTNTYWDNRVLLSVPSKDLDGAVVALVMNIQLITDFEQESDWWNLSGDTFKKWYISVVSMRLLVKKGFVSPDKD